MRAGLAIALAAALASTAAAQATATTGVAAERFVPALGPASLVGVEGAAVTPSGAVSFAAGLDVLRDPIKLTTQLGGEPISRPVHDQFVGDVALEVGFWRRLAVALGVPVVLYQDGDRLRGTGVDERPLQATAAGDVRVRLKAQLVGDAARPGLHASLLVQVTAPAGGQADFAATDGATIEPRLIADWRAGRLTLAVSVGARFQKERPLFATLLGDELTWAAGAMVNVATRDRFAASVVAEAQGAAGASAGTRPVELRGAVRAAFGRFAVDAGAGGGVDGDVGAPAWRVFAVARGTVGK